MAILTLNPPPGVYPTQQTFTVSAPSRYQIISSDDETEPMLVRTVASTDKNGYEQPYMQIVDDGRGRMVLDGAFSKFYNSQYSSTTENARMRFYNNILDYLCRQKKGRKKLLIIGDQNEQTTSASQFYLVKNRETTMSFGLFLVDSALHREYDATVIASDDYPEGDFTVTYQQLRGYDVIVYVSSASSSNAGPWLPTPQFSRNLAQIRREGTGVMITTDHGIGETGFYQGANKMLEFMLDARFDGSYDFSPGTTVQYNRDKWGDSEIFKNLGPNVIIVASNSDSNVIQEVSEPETLPQTYTTNGPFNGYKFCVVDTLTGDVTFEQYSYFIGVDPVIRLLDQQNNIVTNFPSGEVTKRFVKFRFDPLEGMDTISGFIRAGDFVVGTFENAGAGIIPITWLETPFSSPDDPGWVKMPYWYNLPIVFQINTPFQYTDQWNYNRQIPIQNGFEDPTDFYVEAFGYLPTAKKQVSLAGALNNTKEIGAIEEIEVDSAKNTDVMKRFLTTGKDFVPPQA